MNPLPSLAYCTNVRPTEDLDGLLADLSSFWPRVRAAAGFERLDLGLWLPAELAARLRGDDDALTRVRRALDEGGLRVTTVNAFPFGGFHAPVVKERAYQPDWHTEERLRYTLDAAAVLAELIEPGESACLSTVPLGHPRFDRAARTAAAATLRRAAAALEQLQQTRDRRIVIALEPEPGCALESTTDAIDFFTHDLRHDGDTSWVDDHLALCLDLCHSAVADEPPLKALARLDAAGVPVAKVQVSAALEVPDPVDPAQRTALRAFDEPRWLHQVGLPGGRMLHDLGEALALEGDDAPAPWRVHFHVPLHRETVGGLPTTGPQVAEFLASARARELLLECETYTWSALPESGDLAENVAAELRWVAERRA